MRSEVIADTTSEFSPLLPTLKDRRQIRCIHRKLLPRRPGRDAALEQYCTFYESTLEPTTFPPDTLVLTPLVEAGSSLPYYHPAVSHLAFQYLNLDPPRLQIELVPLPGTPTDPNSRLYRTCLALLETVHRYGWGAMTNYKKRVIHDCLVPREIYQDLYLIMRERHKHLVDTWKEVTDPLKHVFEVNTFRWQCSYKIRHWWFQDIGIATYLMLLWKTTFPSGSDDASKNVSSSEFWKEWPRPPGGFLDLGYACSALQCVDSHLPFEMWKWSVDSYPDCRRIWRLRNWSSCTNLLESLSTIHTSTSSCTCPRPNHRQRHHQQLRLWLLLLQTRRFRHRKPRRWVDTVGSGTLDTTQRLWISFYSVLFMGFWRQIWTLFNITVSRFPHWLCW